VIRDQHERKESTAEQSVIDAERKGWAPSQIGDQHGAREVERGAICVKRRMPSVERGVIRDRCNRKARGPATRDLKLSHPPHCKMRREGK